LEEATYKRFEHLAETEPKAGIMFLTGHDYWDVKPKNFEEPWFSRFLKNYRHIPKEELPSGVDFGTTYTTGQHMAIDVIIATFLLRLKSISINTPKYLRYLQDQILARGGIIEHGTVQSLRALAQVPHSDKHPKADII
ncbi:hypothetical protein BX616_009041, partial [Lobosporangium transversale]